jgi:hypothetical protein
MELLHRANLSLAEALARLCLDAIVHRVSRRQCEGDSGYVKPATHNPKSYSHAAYRDTQRALWRSGGATAMVDQLGAQQAGQGFMPPGSAPYEWNLHRML